MSVLASIRRGISCPARAAANDDSTNVNVFVYRGQVILNFVHEGHFRPFALAGYGGYSSYPGTLDPAVQDTDNMIHLGIGLKLRLIVCVVIGFREVPFFRLNQRLQPDVGGADAVRIQCE